jgi:hypothetical protein
MTTPKKPLSKTESAIQLGNIYRFMARGRGRKLRKVGEKASKVSKSKKIGEVQTRPKKSLQNQEVNKGAKVPIEQLQQEQAIKTVVNKLAASTPIKIRSTPSTRAIVKKLARIYKKGKK